MTAKKKENKNEGLESEVANAEVTDISAEEQNNTDPAEVEVQEEQQEEVDELTKLHTEMTELKDKYLRLYSEFENFRRRTAKEKLELINTANESLILSLLPVVDDFERSGSAPSEESDLKTYKQGIDLIFNKLQSTLQQIGLQVMDTGLGAKFDAELHDAITQIPAPKKKLKGKIVDTIEKGYQIGEKVIRHAKVVVGN
jgi:molecular chaperone GrpE